MVSDLWTQLHVTIRRHVQVISADYIFMYFFLSAVSWKFHSHSICYFVLLSGIYMCTYYHSHEPLVFCHLLFSLTVKSLPPLLHVPLVTVTSSSPWKLGERPHNHRWVTTRCLRTDSRLCRASRHIHTHIRAHIYPHGYLHIPKRLHKYEALFEMHFRDSCSQWRLAGSWVAVHG